MSDESQTPVKLPNINEEERDWLTVMLGFFKPKKVYEAFFYEFPRLANYASEHGISDDDLKTILLKRFYEMKKRQSRSTSEVIGAIEKIKNPNFGAFANEAIFAYFVPLETLLYMRNLIIGAAKNFDATNFAKEDATLKDFGSCQE